MCPDFHFHHGKRSWGRANDQERHPRSDLSREPKDDGQGRIGLSASGVDIKLVEGKGTASRFPQMVFLKPFTCLFRVPFFVIFAFRWLSLS